MYRCTIAPSRPLSVQRVLAVAGVFLLVGAHSRCIFLPNLKARVLELIQSTYYVQSQDSKFTFVPNVFTTLNGSLTTCGTRCTRHTLQPELGEVHHVFIERGRTCAACNSRLTSEPLCIFFIFFLHGGNGLQVVLSREQAEGQGALVRRSIGSSMLRNFDPFLMLDEFDVATTAGFPDHPHRYLFRSLRKPPA